MPITPLTTEQNKSVKFLEQQFDKAIAERDVDVAEKAASYLQDVLRNAGQETRLMKYKIELFELYMNLKFYATAIGGFNGIIGKTNKNTRIRIEATALLAICYIRKGEIENAEPLIKEVLDNAKVIKSSEKRFRFRKEIIERFTEEGIFIAIQKASKSDQELSVEKFKEEVQLVTNLPEDVLYETLGSSISQEDITILAKVETFSRLQLPTGERLKLPSPVSIDDKKEVGKKVFSSLKRTLYNAFCDPKSEFYKTWSKGLTRISSGASFLDAVYSLIKGIGINVTILVSPFVALVIRFGIEWYCTHKKPTTIADIR